MQEMFESESSTAPRVQFYVEGDYFDSARRTSGKTIVFDVYGQGVSVGCDFILPQWQRLRAGFVFGYNDIQSGTRNGFEQAQTESCSLIAYARYDLRELAENMLRADGSSARSSGAVPV